MTIATTSFLALSIAVPARSARFRNFFFSALRICRTVPELVLAQRS